MWVGRSRLQKPESMSALYDALNDSGIVTVQVTGS
jgi:hypothetical protein